MKDVNEQYENYQPLFNEVFEHETHDEFKEPQVHVFEGLAGAFDKKNNRLSWQKYSKFVAVAATFLFLISVFSLVNYNGNFQTKGATDQLEDASIDDVLLEMDRVEYQSSRIMPEGALTKN